MRTLEDEDPDSLTYQDVFNASAKGTFAKASEDQITITFEYMFVEDPSDEAELIVYLSDRRQLGEGLVEVARIRPPAPGRAGSIGSDEFAVFSGTFPRGNLNFIRGTYVELELRGTDTRCWIDNWDPLIRCGLVCGDYGGWYYGVPGIEDYLLLLSEYGLANPGDPAIAKGCLDLVNDGVININDLMAWSDEGNLNICPDRTDSTAQSAAVSNKALGSSTASKSLTGSEPLIIFGKPGQTGVQVPEDYLYEVSLDGVVAQSGPAGGNGRLLSDGSGEAWQISRNTGIVHLGTGSVVIGPSAGIPYDDSTVSISFDRSAGIAVMDAAFSRTELNVIYVVPVLVTPPDGDRPFRAAARLALSDGLNDPNYTVQMLYGTDPNTDSTINIKSKDSGEVLFEPDIQHQSEIEVDDDGNVYVLSSHWLNDNDWIVIYNAQQGNMSPIRVCLNDFGIEAPTAMTVSGDGNRLYLTSSVNDSNDLVTQIYCFAISKSGQAATGLIQERIIDVYCPAPELCLLYEGLCSEEYVAAITSMAENPDTGTLYATGFTAPKFPAGLAELPPEIEGVYTTPFLAIVPPEPTGPVTVMQIADDGPDPLALGMSIVWTGGTQPECAGADISGNGVVNLQDFVILAAQWLQIGSDLLADITPATGGDGIVNMLDLAAVADHWLETNCK
jgi:hypothetical protein